MEDNNKDEENYKDDNDDKGFHKDILILQAILLRSAQTRKGLNKLAQI